MTLPWWDRATDWALPPPAALQDGDVQPIRAFDTAEAALQFIGSTAATRMRRCRARRRDGVVVLRLALPEAPLEHALHCLGALPANGSVDRAELERALTMQLVDWVEAWRHSDA